MVVVFAPVFSFVNQQQQGTGTPGDLMSLERDEDKDDKDSRRNRRPSTINHLCSLVLPYIESAKCNDENNSKRQPWLWSRALMLFFVSEHRESLLLV